MNNNTNNNQNHNQNQNQNDNEKNEKNQVNKMAEAEKKSALPILSVGISWVVFALIFRINSSFKFFAVTVLSFIVYQIVKSKFPPKKVELMMEPEKPEIKKPEPQPEEIKKDKKEIKDPELEELNTRIFLYLTEINLLNEAIKDPFISGELYEIEHTLKKIQAQLNDESKPDITKRINQLSDFFDYYMPTTIKILNSYRRIESQELTGENAMETKKRVEETLPLIKKAFAKELDNLFSDEMMDITTDIDVLESMLSKDGLIDKNNLSNVKNVKDMDFFN
jgi:uncharacterized protein YhaN